MKKRAVIYARYSNEKLQDIRSIEDQIAEARITAERGDYDVLGVYTDAGISGQNILSRPGLQAMLKAAKNHEFDAVIVEATSRVARDDTGELLRILKRFRHYGIVLVTRNGVVSKIQAGVDGIVNSQFIDNLVGAVKRGINGRVREGLVPGSMAYGYRGVKETLPNGLVRFKPGVREIDPFTAGIVIRIFWEYADGKSPREIAAGLTRDGIPAPRGGKHWNPSKIVSGGSRHGCILSNELYIGRLVWNKLTYSKDPDTEVRESRPGNPEDILTTEVPHLRIVSQDLWDRAHAVRKARGVAKFGPGGKKRHNIASAEKYLLVGLLRCKACGGNMMIGQSNPDGTSRVVCSYGHRRMGCTHTKSYCLKGLEEHVLAEAKRHLTDPEAVLAYTRAYHARWAERQKEIKSDRADVERELSRVEGAITRLVDVITESAAPPKALAEKLDKLERERAALEDRKVRLDAESNVVELHPAAVEKFCTDMTKLHAILTGEVSVNDLGPAREAFRNVFQFFAVIPTGKRRPYQTEPFLYLSAVTGFDFPQARTNEQVMAEEALSANRICEPSGSRSAANRNSRQGVISLGIWHQAA